jgi:putative ABC transport system permease protein
LTLDDMLRDFVYARPRFSMLLMSTFASIGLVLVATGVYAVVAYSVSRRTREIGIRMALGAAPGQIFAAVIGGALPMIAAGGIVGALASIAADRVISAKVWDVGAFDPATLAGAFALIIAVGLAACFFPALRAVRVHPTEALRQE